MIEVSSTAILKFDFVPVWIGYVYTKAFLLSLLMPCSPPCTLCAYWLDGLSAPGILHTGVYKILQL